jgi:hypothetical protein
MIRVVIFYKFFFATNDDDDDWLDCVNDIFSRQKTDSQAFFLPKSICIDLL